MELYCSIKVYYGVVIIAFVMIDNSAMVMDFSIIGAQCYRFGTIFDGIVIIAFALTATSNRLLASFSSTLW